MKKLKPIKNKLPRDDIKVYLQDQSKILAEFFNGEVIDLLQEYLYESQGISRSSFLQFI